MLIIRGVNVFPSQVEHVILSLGMEPNYQIVVDRVNNLDVMTVKIEMSDALLSDSVRKVEDQENRIKAAMQTLLSLITAKFKEVLVWQFGKFLFL